MAYRTGKFNFSKGEFSEELIARVDVDSYSAGLKRARNVVILKYGGITKRPGTRLVAEVRDASHPVRVIPFQFDEGKSGQNYALEMGHGYMRPSASGGVLLEDRLTITAISLALQAQVTAAYHGYSIGDDVFFKDVAGMTQINGRVGRVQSVPGTNIFTVSIDSSGFDPFTGDAGGIVRGGPPPTPPPPPVIPPVVPTPPPPPVGGGGGSGDQRYDDGTYK